MSDSCQLEVQLSHEQDDKTRLEILSSLISHYKANNDKLRLSQTLDAIISINANLENILICAKAYFDIHMHYKSYSLYLSAIPLLSYKDVRYINWCMVFEIITCSAVSSQDYGIQFLKDTFKYIISQQDFKDECSEFAHCYLMMQGLSLNTNNPSLSLSTFREWNDFIKPHFKQYNRTMKQKNRIRIGYLTTHIGLHAVMFFAYGMIHNHDKSRFDVVVYGERTTNYTNILDSLSFVDIAGMSDPDVALMIVNDDVDILIDLIGYTYKTRINVLLYKPAPLIISMIGFPSSLGLDVVDYKVFDQYTISSSNAFTEKPLILDKGTQCYYNCFHSFNNANWQLKDEINIACFSFPAKFNNETYDAFASIMHSVKNSHIYFCYPHNECSIIRYNIARNLEKRGIDISRITVTTSNDIHYIYQNHMDMSLDTYPYNGATTICDALWCGVPVISLCGDTYMSRMGYSILSCCDCQELVAHTWEEYIQIAIDLANDKNRLRLYHQELHGRFTTSHVGNPKLFTKQLEDALAGIFTSSLGACSSS